MKKIIKKVLICTGYITTLIACFLISYAVTSPKIVTLDLLNKYIGEDGKVHYKINITEKREEIHIDNSSGEDGDSSSDTGDSSSDGDSSAGDISGGSPVTNHQHKAFRQGNYTDVITGSADIASSGCGLCAFTAMMYEAGYAKEPNEWLEYFDAKDESIRAHWSSGAMSWNFPEDVVDKLNKIGETGTWELCGADALGETIDDGEFRTFITEHLGHGDYIMASAKKGLLTNNGHIVLITDLAGDGYFHMSDSSGMGASHMGKDWGEMCTYAFPIESDEEICSGYKGKNEGGYEFKCLWAIHHTP